MWLMNHSNHLVPQQGVHFLKTLPSPRLCFYESAHWEANLLAFQCSDVRTRDNFLSFYKHNNHGSLVLDNTLFTTHCFAHPHFISDVSDGLILNDSWKGDWGPFLGFLSLVSIPNRKCFWNCLAHLC